MKDHYSLIIIGAGPAGMEAAIQASEFDVDVAVLDEQPGVGGQIYRNVANSVLPDMEILGKDYCYGQQLAEQFLASGIDYFPGASVWNLDSERNVSVLIEGENYFVSADQIINCTGAQERPMPFPGWELPGVMTVGAAQILLKASAAKPDGEVVLAGSGPLLFLLAGQYIKAGASVKSILDTTPGQNLKGAVIKFPQALLAPQYLLTGLALIKAIRNSGIPSIRNVVGLRAHGDKRLEQVSYQHNGKVRAIEASLLLTHAGVIPQLHLSKVAGCEVFWNESQVCWHTRVDQWGQTSVPGIFAAGDNQSIMGARGAQLHGQLCGLKAIHQMQFIDDQEFDRRAHRISRKMQRHLAVRPFLDALYRPSSWLLLPSDETIVCRCEEVRAEEIRSLAKIGCQGPNQMKSFSRCGMGPCQGRQCGSIVSAILAAEQGRSAQQVGYFRVRPPIKPVSLGQL